MAGTREYGLAPAPEPEQVPELTRVVLVATRWHGAIVERMVEGATRALQAQGVAADYIEVVRVPGAWELPLAASWYTLSGGYGLEITERVGLETEPHAENEAYLRTKAEKLGHLLTLPRTGTGGPMPRE